MNNRTARWLLALLALSAILGSFAAGANGDPSSPAWRRPELEYLEAVNRVGPPQDPQVLFLLMGQYASANLHREGAERLSALLKEFEPRLSNQQKALYLAAIGALRAGHANQVPLLRRFGWVKDTISILEDAKQKSGGNIYVVRWISGVVYAQLPGMFGKRQSARDDLNWCLQHTDKAPHPGWTREVYFNLAKLLKEDGDAVKAQQFLRLSGFPDFDKPVTVTAPNSVDRANGHTFSARAHRRGRAEEDLCPVRLRVHRVLLRRVGGRAGIDRDRRGHAPRLGAGGLRGAASLRARLAGAYDDPGHALALGPCGRASLLPEREPALEVLRACQLSRGNHTLGRCAAEVRQAVLRRALRA